MSEEEKQFEDWMNAILSKPSAEELGQMRTEMMLYQFMTIHNIDQNISLIRDILVKINDKM